MSDEKIPIALVYKIDTPLGTQTDVYMRAHTLTVKYVLRYRVWYIKHFNIIYV